MSSYKGYRRTIQLDFNYDAVKEGVPKVNQQMAMLNSEFNKASAQVVATGNAMDKLTITNQKLGNQVQLQKDKVSNLEKELAKLTTSETKNEKAIASKTIELKNAQGQLTRLETAYSKSNTEIAKSSTLLGKAKLEMESFRMGAERAGVDLDKVKMQFVALGTAVTAFGVVTGKAFMEYEGELVQARNLMDESVMSYNEMSEGIKGVANEYGIAYKDMAKAQELALSSNIATADSIEYLDKISKFHVATRTDLNTVTDMTTSIMNAYKISVDDATKMMDNLIKTQNLAKVSWEDYNSQIGDLVGLGSQIGVSLSEINAALIVQTSKGIDSATALTNLKNILQTMSAPSAETATACKELGIEFSASALKSKGFARMMEDVTRKTKGNDEAMSSLFGNVRAWTGATVIATDGGKEFKAALEALDGATGNLDNSFNNVAETTNYKFGKAVAELKNSLVELGDKLSPLIEVVASVVSAIAKLPAPVVLTIGAVTILGVTLSLLQKIFTSVTMGGGVLSTVLTTLGLTTGIASTGMVTASTGGGLLSKVLTTLGLTGATTAASLSGVATSGAAAGTALGIAGASTGVATAGLASTGVAGTAAGAGLMATGAGGTMAIGPLLLIVVAVAALALVFGILTGKLGSTKSELKDVGNIASKTASDVKLASESATSSANRMTSSANSASRRTGYATGTNFVKESGRYRIEEYGDEDIYLPRGTRVDSAERTRQNNNSSSSNNEETNSLLRALIAKVDSFERTTANLPRTATYLNRGGNLGGAM